MSKQDNDDKEIKNILVSESTDILSKYRIPIVSNIIDFNLQLPEDSDSSDFS